MQCWAGFAMLVGICNVGRDLQFVWEPQHYALSSAVDYYEQRKGKIDIVFLE
jgi:hypothetical protein